MTYQEKAEQYVRKQLNLSEDEPLALQHWLRVLAMATNGNWMMSNKGGVVADGIELFFNLTTGQPATEADYQAFCEIVGA